MAAFKLTDDELIAKVEETTVEATRHQLDTLRKILDRNAAVGYLRQAAGAVDVHNFRRTVPLSTYDDYADHISKIADGLDDYGDGDSGRHFLSFDPLVCFFLSSGTSQMRQKLLPYFDSAPSKAASYLAHMGSAALLRRQFPPRATINKSLWFLYAGNITTTKGGFKAMAASSLPLSGTKETQSQFLSTCIAPAQVVMGSNLQHQMYCHLLCGLRRFDLIDSIRAPYAISLVRAFSMLKTKWEQLCDDLDSGVLCSEVTDIAMRDAVTEFLDGPNPDIADRVRLICREQSWDGIIARLWPNVRYVKCIATGIMQQYYKKLKHYAGDIPLIGGDYFASECCVGINVDIMQPPENTRFVILPATAYFEFLPFDLEDDSFKFNKETVDISGVHVGKMYEVVVTTFRGLYRYCLGDVVKVVGFHNSSPEIEFVMRAPKSSTEFVTERDLMRAVWNLELELEGALSMGQITEFASFMDMDESGTKQLTIYIEFAEGSMILEKGKEDRAVAILRSCGSSIEDGLGVLYKSRRETGKIAPLRISIVNVGTFDLLLQVAIENGAPASQYKSPKIIRNQRMADFLEASSTLTVSFS